MIEFEPVNNANTPTPEVLQGINLARTGTAFIGSIIVFIFFLPLILWISTTGNVLNYFVYDVPAGQLAYVFSKLTGLYAVFLLWAQIFFVLLNQVFSKQIITPSNHAILGALSTLAVVIHATLFILATSVRTGELTIGVLNPTFTEGFYKLSVSIGVISMWILAAVILASVIRKRNNRFGKWIHRLAFVTFLLSIVHSFLIGTEAQMGIMNIIHGVMLMSVFGLAMYCLLKSRLENTLPALSTTSADR